MNTNKSNKFFFTPLHKKTKRNYIERMMNNKVAAMKVAELYDFDYWDGDRKYGYGGYKYINGYFKPMAEQLIKEYNLNNHSSILDVGCGKAFLLYELKKILPDLNIAGFDCSNYAIQNSKDEIKNFLFKHSADKPLPFEDKKFDLVISTGCLHNLKLQGVKLALNEISRVGKKSYVMVESYRNRKELFNLQCWALTCQTFLDESEWLWLFDYLKFNGDYEFIFFE